MKYSYNQIFNELSKSNSSGRSMSSTQYSKLNLKIVKLLLNEGIICGYLIDGNLIRLFSTITNNKPTIIKINNISKPGNRVYWSALKLKNISFYKPGIYVLHTSKGLMCGEKAIQLNTGGEVLCYINV